MIKSTFDVSPGYSFLLFLSLSSVTSKPVSPHLTLVIGALCISLSPILTRLSGTPGLSSAFYRVFFASLLFIPYVLIKGRYRSSRSNILLALLAGGFFGCDLACWNQSIMMSDIAIATVLANLAPVWAGLILWILYHKEPGRNFWIGLIIALIGLVVLTGADIWVHMKFETGNLLALLAGFLYSWYLVITGRVRSGMSNTPFMFYSLIGYLITSGLIVLILHYPVTGFNNRSWLFLILLALIPQLAGWLLVNHSLGHIPTTEVSISMLGQIVITLSLAAILFNERLSLHQWVGCTIILSGIAYIQLMNNRSHLKSEVKV